MKPEHDFWGTINDLPDSEAVRLCKLLDEEAAVEQFADARRLLLDSVGVSSGSTLLDLGAGPACHLEMTVRRLGPQGRWICVDKAVAFAREAESRLSRVGGRHKVLVADVRKIPIPDAIADFVIADKLMIHVGPIDSVVGEMARLVRPGGWVGSCDAEADATFVHSSDLSLTRRITRFWSDLRPTPNAASRAAEAFSCAGLVDVRRMIVTIVLTDVTEPFFSRVVPHWANKAAVCGAISEGERDLWVADVMAKGAVGAALIAIPMVITIARRPKLKDFEFD